MVIKQLLIILISLKQPKPYFQHRKAFFEKINEMTQGLRKKVNNRKIPLSSQNYYLVAQSSVFLLIFVFLSILSITTLKKKKLKYPCSALIQMKATLCLKYFFHDRLQKNFFASKLSLDPFQLDLFESFGNYNYKG